MTDTSFSIRTAEKRDLATLQAICEEHGLGFIENTTDTTVAVDEGDKPVGFIHIEVIRDDDNAEANGNFVYPVAVFEAWQRRGVATALMEHELAKRGELKLVACKESQGFYPKVGFEPVDWNHIAARIAWDCERCTAREACGPIPFCKVDEGTVALSAPFRIEIQITKPISHKSLKSNSAIN